MIPVTAETAASFLPERSDFGDKHSFGKLLCVCGSLDMPGAAVMSCLSALRSGAGLVTLASVRPVIDAALMHITEATFLTLPGSDAPGEDALPQLLSLRPTAVLLGCGIGTGEKTQRLVKSLISACASPLLLDADGLNCIRSGPEVLKKASAPVVITPHHGEMSRLTGLSRQEISGSPASVAADFAEKYGVTVVLKGPETHIASPEGSAFVLSRPNSGLSKGGSGDVLAGCIASLLAQGAPPAEAAVCGAWLHSEAAALAAEAFGKRSMLARDVIDMLPRAFMKAEDFSRPGVSANI